MSNFADYDTVLESAMRESFASEVEKIAGENAWDALVTRLAYNWVW